MPENHIFCQSCDCEQVVKNGFTHNANQNFLCKSCGRQFVLDSKNEMIEQETLIFTYSIDRLLRDMLQLAGIARVSGVSERWLQTYVNTLDRSIKKMWKFGLKKRATNALSVMKCGRLQLTRRISSGSGWR